MGLGSSSPDTNEQEYTDDETEQTYSIAKVCSTVFFELMFYFISCLIGHCGNIIV